MKRKNVIILLAVIIFVTTLGSVALFTNLDRISDNYLHIGKIKKQVENLTGYVFEYSNVHKEEYKNYDDWKVDIGKNAYDAIYKTNSEVVFLYFRHDLNELTENIKNSYILMFDAKDRSLNSTIDPATMKLNIVSSGQKKEYSFSEIQQYATFFNFDESQNKYIPLIDQSKGGQSVIIDLKQFLDKNMDVDNTTATLETSQGNYTLSMANLSADIARVVGSLYEYNNYQKRNFRNYSKWLSTLADTIFKKYYSFEPIGTGLTAHRVQEFRGHSNYVTIVHGANFESSNTFAKKDLSIEIKTPSTYRIYSFDTLKSKAMFYDYYEDRDEFEVDDPGFVVDALFVDLKDILDGHLNEQFIKIKINTSFSDIYFDIK